MRARLLTASRLSHDPLTLHGVGDSHWVPFGAYAEVDSGLHRVFKLTAEAADGPDDGLTAELHSWESTPAEPRRGRIRMLNCPVVLPPGRWLLRLMLDDRTLDRRWVEVKD